jgi:hypothetical protein
MDLSFKMIQGSTNVFAISAWNAEAHRKFVFCLVHVHELLIMLRVEHMHYVRHAAQGEEDG